MLVAMNPTISYWLSQVHTWFSLDQAGLSTVDVQEKIEQAIIQTGVRTKYGRTLRYGNCMTVAMGEDAYKAILPVQRQVLKEIQKHLPAKLQREHWHLPDPTLRIAVVRGPHLSPTEVSAEAADEDVTPDYELNTWGRTNRSNGRIRLSEVGPGGRAWEIDPHSSVLIGRKPKNSAASQVGIALENDYVSARHLVIEATTLADGTPAVLVTDQDSRHGTKVNGMPIRPRTPVTVTHGQTIELAGRAGKTLRVIVPGAGSDGDATQGFMDDDDVTLDLPSSFEDWRRRGRRNSDR